MQISPSVPPIASAPPDGRQSDIRTAAAGFEEMFLVFMLRAGRAGGVGDNITGSAAVTATRDMLDAQLARSAASMPRLGIAEAVARQFFSPAQGGR